MLAQEFAELSNFKDVIDSLPYRIGKHMTNPSIGLRYAPISDELVALFTRFNIFTSLIKTRDYFRSLILDDNDFHLWGFESRRFCSTAEIWRVCKDRIALLVVRSHYYSDGYHLVVWDGKQLLDPSPDVLESELPILDWDKYSVIEAIIFHRGEVTPV